MIEEEGWVVKACRWGRAELSRSPGALKKKDLRALTRTRRASHERDPRTTPLSLFPPPPSSSSSTSSPLQKKTSLTSFAQLLQQLAEVRDNQSCLHGYVKRKKKTFTDLGVWREKREQQVFGGRAFFWGSSSPDAHCWITDIPQDLWPRVIRVRF